MRTPRCTTAGLGMVILSAALPSDAGATTGPLPPECQNPNLSATAQARCDFIARTPDLCLRAGLSEDTRRFCDELGEAPEPTPEITVSPELPADILGGAPTASPAQAAAFAWQEFIALNWPAGPQLGLQGQRDTPSDLCRFGDPTCTGPTVWETFRSKVEIFPGSGNPPGYPGASGDPSYGYDALPEYIYAEPIEACDPSQAGDPVPWVNLDETDQITLDNMYAGTVRLNASPGNGAPQLIRFLAKANRVEYAYVAGNSSPTDPDDQWWHTIPADVVDATKDYLAENLASPPAGSSTMVSLPFDTVEMKAGWRPLNPSELASGRFHAQTVRFYELSEDTQSICYRNAVWGLVALHIMHKTPSASYFIFATFEQADNIMTASGRPIEDRRRQDRDPPERDADGPAGMPDRPAAGDRRSA